jgi:transmembrane sensor
VSEQRTPVGKWLREDADAAGLERVWRGVQRRRAERARRAPHVRWVGGLAVAAAVLLVAIAWRGRGQGDRSAAIAPDRGALALAGGGEIGSLLAESAARDVPLADGSRILLDAGTAIEPLQNGPTEFSALVARGRATFDVRPGGPRRWVLECGLATVEVVGTRFTVERAAHVVRVSVERGIVLVRGERVRDRVQRLTAGDSLDVDDGLLSALAPPRTDDAPAVSAVAALAPVRAPSVAASTHVAAAAREWRGLEQSGDHAAAYAELGPAGIASASKGASVEDLLALADVARLSGHPADAVVPLSRVVAEHADDPTAPLAAFTLGRLQLDALGQPAPAAEAFSRALELGLPQSLQEDVYARLVEARARAGDMAGAREAAQQYEARFPAGKRLAEVRRRTGGP